MNNLASDLGSIVERAAEQLLAISESRSQVSNDEGQWSAKQVLGHLIDSAANNHQRFVRAQFTADLLFPGYDQEQWIKVQRYEEEPWLALVGLWRSYNGHLAHIIANIPESALTRRRYPHNLDQIAWQTVSVEEPTTLEYLIRDYIGHLQNHLEQLLAVAKA
jgi:hypothetical protein